MGKKKKKKDLCVIYMERHTYMPYMHIYIWSVKVIFTLDRDSEVYFTYVIDSTNES